MKKLVMMVAAMVAWCAVAEVPTQAEFNTAGKVIENLLEPELVAMKSGKKKSAEVADYAMSLIGESETAAAKFLLARRAYGLYMKGGAYDKAADAIGAMRTAVPDIPNDQLLKAIQPAARKVFEKKAPAVYAIIADLKGKVRSQNEIVRLEGELKNAKTSEQVAIHRQLGECHAVMGDWKKALEHFAKCGGEVAKIAMEEASGKSDANKFAGFWWDYSESSTIKKSVATAMRQHAAEIYQKGLDEGVITGLNKKLAEQRVEEAKVLGDKTTGVFNSPERVSAKVPGMAIRFGFDGNLRDDVGKGKWESNKKVKWCADNRSRSGKAIVLDGATMLSNDRTFTEIENQMTIAAWVKPEGRIERFVAQRGGGTDGCKAFGPALITAINYYEDRQRTGQGVLIGENGIMFVEHGPCHLPAQIVYEKELGKKWIHVAVVIEKGKGPLLYVNGEKVAQGEKSGKTPYLRFGKLPEQCISNRRTTVLGGAIHGMKPFVGAVADLAVYNRVLTPEEIMRLYRD